MAQRRRTGYSSRSIFADNRSFDGISDVQELNIQVARRTDDMAKNCQRETQFKIYPSEPRHLRL